MFTDISWMTYLLVIGTATLLWYLSLTLAHHYRGVKNFLDGKRNSSFDALYTPQPAEQATPQSSIANSAPNETALQDFDMIEELVERVKSIVSEAKEKHMPKDGFYALLQNLLKDYPTLKKSQFRPSVSEFIAGESEEQGLEGITIEAIENLWEN